MNIITGKASYYENDEDLLAYVKKHGHSLTFGPVVDRCVHSMTASVYSFSFIVNKGEGIYPEELDNCTIAWSINGGDFNEI